MALIKFSSQNGSTEAGNTIRPLQKELNEIFNDLTPKYYCCDLDYFSIVFRVSGKNRDFNYEGAELLKKVRNKNVYTIDYSIPEARWAESDEREFKSYVSKGVFECFGLLLEKVMVDRMLIEKDSILFDFEKKMSTFC
jgi:hypothetical protein